MISKGLIVLSLGISVCALARAQQQSAPDPRARPAVASAEGAVAPAPGQVGWIVRCTTPGVDFSVLRDAYARRARPDEIASIVASYEMHVKAARAGLFERVTMLGGRVTNSWWIVNAVGIEIADDEAVIAALRALPGVGGLEPVRVVRGTTVPRAPLQDAVNVWGHNAVAAHAAGWTGAISQSVDMVVSIAVLDSELLTQMDPLPAARRHHAVLRLDGMTTKATRVAADIQISPNSFAVPSDHGLSIASIAAGCAPNGQPGTWSGGGWSHGHAPGAEILSVNIAIDAAPIPTSDSATLLSAWQWVTAHKSDYGIVVAVNSFGGDPDPTAQIQSALDTCADVADVLVVVSGGNGIPPNQPWWSTPGTCWDSQYVANGIAVGAAGMHSRFVPLWATVGPMTPLTTLQGLVGTNSPTPSGYERQYPDLIAAGETHLLPNQADESASIAQWGGSSLAAPHVAGAGYLWICGPDNGTTLPARTALMARAALLATAEDVSVQNNVSGLAAANTMGAGFLRTDWLTSESAALGLDVQQRTETVSTGAVRTYSLNIVQGRTYAVAVAWKRTDYSPAPNWPNLDLVLDPSFGLDVGSASETSFGVGMRRTWERMTFVAPFTGAIDYEVHFTSVPVAGAVTFATATTELPGNTAARVEEITGNAGCITQGFAPGSVWSTMSSLPGGNPPLPPSQNFTNSDCATPGSCLNWELDEGWYAVPFGLPNPGVNGDIEFWMRVGAEYSGTMECYTVSHSPAGASNGYSYGPSTTIIDHTQARVFGGIAYGRIRHGSFLVMNFGPKMWWVDRRFVPAATWTAWQQTSGFPRWKGTFVNGAFTGFTPAHGIVTLPSGFIRHPQWQLTVLARVPTFGGGSPWYVPLHLDRDRLQVPRLGTTFEVQTNNFTYSPAPTGVWLAIGLVPTAPWLVPGSTTCYWLINPSTLLPSLILSNGSAQNLVPIPHSASLAGAALEMQSVLLHPNPNPPDGLATSNAIRAVIGF